MAMFQHVALLNTTAKHAFSLTQVVTKRQINKIKQCIPNEFPPPYS